MCSREDQANNFLQWALWAEVRTRTINLSSAYNKKFELIAPQE